MECMKPSLYLSSTYVVCTTSTCKCTNPSPSPSPVHTGALRPVHSRGAMNRGRDDGDGALGNIR